MIVGLRRISNLQGSKEQVQHEVVLPMGYVVDILIGKKLVIELDGPKHFSSDRYPLGRSASATVGVTILFY